MFILKESGTMSDSYSSVSNTYFIPNRICILTLVELLKRVQMEFVFITRIDCLENECIIRIQTIRDVFVAFG